ncbi:MULTISPECIES: single-stranded DNA-binding protein [Micrococcales]|jgi:single-strand DNA-binding protein|uniref:Single-stranded DNA-binding protein n=3 Tax=Micrococcales TaxID=85006 RepID=A0A7T3ZZ08_9MICO|nr:MULTISPECIES: single-stranded DNA-binding protein [Micrococcales]HLR95159.1 hypothetical protein [Jiangellaceae bacterium]MCT1615395.1 single-stranded DNA-binding protein [Kocuria marina]NDO77324.1 single-stranded DNA-binding protein [Kocuria indica]QQB14293.1 single-stranded DNA-binding protein [Brevibacterium casei]BDZ59247.1 hypothetical protein GCM10025872_29040 [Barrientosiimonas endolithica]
MAEEAHPEQAPEPEADVRQSFKGRIVSTPSLDTTSTGKAKFYAKVEQRHWNYESDGTYTRLPNSYHDLVAYKGAAVRAYKNLLRGDYFIAEGRMEEYTSKSTGEMKERFVATGLGHDMAHTRYDVDRSPRREVAERAAGQQTPERDTSHQRAPEPEGARSRPAQPPPGPREQVSAFEASARRPVQQPPAMGL